MNLKTILLKGIKEIDNIYHIICEDITSSLCEEIAEEITCIDSILWDYICYYTKEDVEISEIEDLEIMPEYKDEEQKLI
jgi:hypothetical protein